MIQYKKILMTLALLLTAVTGAWAEEKMVTINSSTMSSGAVTATGFNIIENFLYVSKKTATITTSEGVITKLVIKKYDGSFGDAFTEANVGVTPGTITYGSDEITVTDINAESVTLSIKGNDNWSTSSVAVYYGEPTEWPLTPNAEKKVWTLAKMPASDIELQVEYYPESNIYLSKDAKGVLEVKNEGETLAFDDNGKSTTTVSETNTITAKFTGKKVLGLKVTKRISYPIAISAVTSDYIGSVVTTDGDVYATVAAATAASKTPVAMIAYVGTESDCAHGLAIALEDVSNEKLTWNNSGNNNESKTAAEWCSAWNTSKAVTGGTWRLPSISDWQYMFIGCGASESYSDNPIQMSYSGLASKLTTAQGDALPVNADYWSSTVASPSYPWTVRFGDSYAFFYNNTWEGHAFDLVRACLAF